MSWRCAILVVLALCRSASADGWWLDPIDQVALHLDAVHERDRPYSVAAKPRDIAGGLALSCEHREGAPCGDGVGAYLDGDASAGFGDWLVAAVRLRAVTGTGTRDTALEIDRAHVGVRRGPVAVEVGRDAFVLGPVGHTQVGWGDNAPPLDHASVAIAADRGRLLYVVGRLRDPQRFPGNLVTIARGELQLGAVRLGGMQLLQLEGEGAPHLGVWDFLVEHVTRTEPSAGPTDSSNRRVGLDVEWRIAGFGGARLYGELMFEDWRRQFADALRYDADKVVGADFPGGLLVEVHHTWFRSMEHVQRTTGFTNAGQVVGSPLGPDAAGLYVAQRLIVGRALVVPWVELARLASDSYTYGFHQPIIRFTDGQPEARYRAGVHVAAPLSPRLRIEVDAMVEHVEDYAFVTGARREHAGLLTTIVWRP